MVDELPPSLAEGMHCDPCALGDVALQGNNPERAANVRRTVEAKVNVQLAHPARTHQAQMRLANLPALEPTLEYATDNCATTIARDLCPILRTQRQRSGEVQLVPRDQPKWYQRIN